MRVTCNICGDERDHKTTGPCMAHLYGKPHCYGDYLTSLHEISSAEETKAIKMFGPGKMILAHVHDGKKWSQVQMVIWLPPEGEFGR